MAPLLPIVRHLILCQDIRSGEDEESRFSLIRLVHYLRSTTNPPYPCRVKQLCAFILLTECRGPGTVALDILQEDTGTVIWQTATRPVAIPNDPLAMATIIYRERGCVFPEPGLYSVRFWYNGVVLAQEPLVMR
jgi:hypothetical protein